MAFTRGMGGFLRRMLPECGLTAAPKSFLPLYETARSMSSSKLFIGGLSWETKDETLEAAFSSYGVVTEAKIITDRDTGRSRGFGFVSFTSDQDAEAALQAMDGRELGGRTVRVDYATERGSGFSGASGRFGAGDRGRQDDSN
ncbi:hypothetical protein O6H91_16G070100 [Diphasiastrum complanatum]|uniref:Uncharacterized protein n=1 Tax=Diphasiastrum complanatum TaxID=34168 RepID=A0ACC2BD70_DIPCM|nr:hypothetical protein O6H91_Y257900 [Diphasiastrum complanatum]KAJ7527773.1 hypothetical protein O6H91_16G070100 [Diphasiastrum complanatum]